MRLKLAATLIALSMSSVQAQQYIAGPANMSTGQITVGSTPTLIVVNRTRLSVTVVNSSTVAVYIGGPNVTIATGVFLAGVAGASVTLPTIGAVYGVVASGTEGVSFVDLY